MTQLGEGRGAAQAPPILGAPTVGEILAERYQLEQHINNDSAGRQIWQGIDVILRRPVAVVIRYPGGAPATQMLQSAVEASRIVHPNLVGVYDAIDEGARAYVVREWVDGASLRDHIAMGPFDAERAIAVAHAVSAAVTAVHSTGMTHGNIHPGTALIGSDGRVVLADGRADGSVPPEEDVRAVGALLYFALTGYWPHAEVGPTALPDALRDATGALVSPRQVRAGVPNHLDDLVMDLLDRRIAVPSAEVLTGEMARLDSEAGAEVYYAEAGPLSLVDESAAAPPRPAGRKIAFGVSGLLVIGIVGLLIAIRFLNPGGDGTPVDAGSPTGPPATAEPSGPAAGNPTPIALDAAQVRIVDGRGGARDELDGAGAVVDGDESTAWETDTYIGDPVFGGIKPGMGVLIDLGEPRPVTAVEVVLSGSGATAALLAGDNDPGATAAGDVEIVETFTPVGEPFTRHDGAKMVFNADSEATYRFLLVWITELPPVDGGFGIGVQEISVKGP